MWAGSPVARILQGIAKPLSAHFTVICRLLVLSCRSKATSSCSSFHRSLLGPKILPIHSSALGDAAAPHSYLGVALPDMYGVFSSRMSGYTSNIHSGWDSACRVYTLLDGLGYAIPYHVRYFGHRLDHSS